MSLPLTDPFTDFTEREEEVLGLLAQGLTNPEIASRMFISVNTVRTHYQNIMLKISLEPMTIRELIVWAVRAGY